MFSFFPHFKMASLYRIYRELHSVTCSILLAVTTAINTPGIAFYVPDDDIVASNDMFIRGELDVMFEELNLPLSRNEISKAIKQLTNNKGAGSDNMINEFFIHETNILLPYFDFLFNTIFSNGYFPQDWSIGEIIPLHKKGSINNIDNYRGITLLSTLGK